MTEREVARWLAEAALAFSERDDVGLDIATTTFREAGVLTDNAGFVLRAGPPGSPEFQITIVRSN